RDEYCQEDRKSERQRIACKVCSPPPEGWQRTQCVALEYLHCVFRYLRFPQRLRYLLRHSPRLLVVIKPTGELSVVSPLLWQQVIVRSLPHELSEEDFTAACVSLAAEASLGKKGGLWDILYFNAGKLSKKRGKVPGTAYMRFTRGKDIDVDANVSKFKAAVISCEALSAGKERGRDGTPPPVVEPAPFQKLFRQKPKRDLRVGTIKKDAAFKAFCEALEAPVEKLPSADVQADIREAEGKEDPEPVNALLEYVKERRLRRSRDAQRSLLAGGAVRRSVKAGGGNSGNG
ncbi:unnamed protein product, partial [Discosporangium mesarthrocarpum]